MRQYTFLSDKFRAVTVWLLLAVLLLPLTGCRRERDPHEGMVQAHDGNSLAWVRPWKGAAVNDRTAADFYTPDAGHMVSYTGEEYNALQGVDVSYYQGEIDWDAVKADGIDFAIIRAGYRGYTDGNISMDSNFPQNAEGALRAGLQIGLYFFSQATTVSEAEEEARWLLQAKT